MTREVVATIVLALLGGASLAGASGADAVEWSLPECSFVKAHAQVPRERVEPLLPPGFAPVVEREPPFDSRAYLTVEIAVCGEVSYGNWHVAAYPPRDLRVEDVRYYYVKLDTMISDDAQRKALEALGLPVHDGMSGLMDDALGMRLASMEMEGIGAFEITSMPTALSTPASDHHYVEYTQAADGSLVRWGAHTRGFSYAEGRGTLEVPEGSQVAQLLGATLVPAYVTTGGWADMGGLVKSPGSSTIEEGVETEIEAAATSAPPPPIPADRVAVALALGGLGALIGAWVARPLRLFPLFLLYTRLSTVEAATHPRRQQILAIVREDPGIVVSRLREATGFPPGVLYHHLAILEHHGLVHRRREGHVTRVFLVGGPEPAFATDEQRLVLDAVQARPGMTQAELAALLGFTRWGLAYHARRLQQRGRLRIDVVGRTRRYYPADASQP